MLDLIVLFSLVLMGFFVGSHVEKKHYKKIHKEEQELAHIPYSNLKKLPSDLNAEVFLISSSVVISHDYFKKIMGALVSIFGGRLFAYEPLLDRARREAIIRLKKEALKQKAQQIYNLRIETSSISAQSQEKNSMGTVEVMAYATAVKLNK